MGILSLMLPRVLSCTVLAHQQEIVSPSVIVSQRLHLSVLRSLRDTALGRPVHLVGVGEEVDVLIPHLHPLTS